MSYRNSIGRLLAARFETVSGSSSRIAAHGIAFVVLGVIWPMDGASVVATCVAPLTLGGLLLAGAAVANRTAKESCKYVVELRRVRVQPRRQR